jgi:hypothetical protein
MDALIHELQMIDKTDYFQMGALLIFIVEVIFIGVYYNDYGVPSEMYVSDILFEVLPYKVLMTIFVVCQTMISLMFVSRAFAYSKFFFTLMAFSITICLAGWIALNTAYKDNDGKVGDTHTYGTIVFMAGCVLYTILLLYTIRYKIAGICQFGWDNVLALLVLILMVLTVIFGAIFVASLVSDSTDAWLFEHTAFMVAVLAHIFFFSIETPNPWKPLEINDPSSKYRVEDVETSIPLLQEPNNVTSVPITPDGSLLRDTGKSKLLVPKSL